MKTIPNMTRAHTLTVGEALLWLETVQRCYGPEVPLCFVHGAAPDHGRLWLHVGGGCTVSPMRTMHVTEETGSPIVLLYETTREEPLC